mmetsp:Transcript_7387/g.992  ORF Transcript_7387/g.992 Transcript_7387/m.992 type:complete len:90 (-) Transcript_7387:74-343(-)
MIIDAFKGYIVSSYPMLDTEKISELTGFKAVSCGTTNSFTKDNELARSKNVDIVEMEAAAESRVCYLNDVAFSAIKIVSDVEMDSEEER